MTEAFYEDRDNIRTLTLQKRNSTGSMVNLTEPEMAAITKVAVKYLGTYYDSDDYPSGFDWTTLASSAKLILKLGKICPSGRDSFAELSIYDAINTSGIIWGVIDIRISGAATI